MSGGNSALDRLRRNKELQGNDYAAVRPNASLKETLTKENGSVRAPGPRARPTRTMCAFQPCPPPCAEGEEVLFSSKGQKKKKKMGFNIAQVCAAACRHMCTAAAVYASECKNTL